MMINVCITQIINTAIETILVKETFITPGGAASRFLTNKNSDPEYCNYNTVLQITN